MIARKAQKQRTRKRRSAGNRARRRSADALASTRERILASASRLFAQHGFESASMPAIAKASGITAGAIYKHFESKGELLLEVVRRSFLSIPLFARGAEQQADATLLPLLAAAYTKPELKLVRQLSIEVHSAASKDPKVNRVLSESDDLLMTGISDSIAAAQKAGKLDAELNPEFVGRLFCVFIMGLTHLDTLLPGLLGDHAWSNFVRDRIATLIGVR
ncbi:MAG: TetR/AcrR family transcriptional regulator [Candidatus Binataceae bacterium]